MRRHIPLLLEKTMADVGPAQRTLLAGRYALDVQSNMILTITVDSGCITLDIPGQIRTEIHPESATRYFSLEQELDLAFSRGDDGKVTGFVLSAGSGTYKAKRVD